MKTIATLAGVSVIAFASMADTPTLDNHDEAIAQLVDNLVTVLKSQSSDEFVKLFPSVEQFHALMTDNAGFYASSLPAAKEDFARTYRQSLLPVLRLSFNQLIKDGVEMGISWKGIRLVRWETSPTSPSGKIQLVAIIEDRGIEHKVIIENALIINGGIYVSSAIRIA